MFICGYLSVFSDCYAVVYIVSYVIHQIINKLQGRNNFGSFSCCLCLATVSDSMLLLFHVHANNCGQFPARCAGSINGKRKRPSKDIIQFQSFCVMNVQKRYMKLGLQPRCMFFLSASVLSREQWRKSHTGTSLLSRFPQCRREALKRRRRGTRFYFILTGPSSFLEARPQSTSWRR